MSETPARPANADAGETRCQEIAFVGARCVVEVGDDPGRPGAGYVARLSVVDEGDHVLRPLVFGSGERVVVKATTEAATLRAAIGYLESRFGALCEPEHQCVIDPRRTGPPLMVEPSAADASVDEASEESFPASDPPTSTPMTGAKLDEP